MFDAAAWLISKFYDLTSSYALAIALVAIVVMLLITPLTLKSTKGMLEMQRLQPEMRRLQAQHRGDRQKLNEEMMKLYQEHKVNPLASCLPLVAQFPVFIVMFRVLHGITNMGANGFAPKYLDKSSALYKSLSGRFHMNSIGLDLAARPAEVLGDSFGRGLAYAGLVVVLGALYYVQQRMVASRTTTASMSPAQAKLMQYLPVAFAAFQFFFPTGLIIYYLTQTVFRIGQQAYITRRFYHGDESLGRQAQAAGVRAREITEAEKATKAGSAKPAPTSVREAARELKAAKQAKAGAANGDGANAKGQGNQVARKGGAAGTRPAKPSTRPGSQGSARATSSSPGRQTPAPGATKAGASSAKSAAAPTAAAAAPGTTAPKNTPTPANRPTPSGKRPQRPGGRKH